MALVFKIADDSGLLLLDLKDLQAMLQHVGDSAKDYQTQYGNISAASVGAIQRGLLQIEEQGGAKFFGEPMLNVDDLMQTIGGKGVVNIVAADRLITNPRLYASFLLWLLSELYEHLPEVGDLEKPKLVFFFDEAHLLFADAPAALLEKVELVVRLIRSKGVGVYFATQNPLDIPDKVLGQLGNRVQHALRAFTPRDQKAVKTAADTFRANPKLDVARVITELGVGEALATAVGVATVLWLIIPIAISSAMIAEIVAGSVSPGMHTMSNPNEHTDVIASSFSSESHPFSAACAKVESSATGMNSPGRIIPLVGCCHRTSASSPTTRPVCNSTWG